MREADPTVRVLVLSKDRTLLANQGSFGDTLQRHVYYAERLHRLVPGSEMRILAYSEKDNSQQQLTPSPNLRIFGTASMHRSLFVLDAVRAIPQVCNRWSPSVITTQEPFEDGELGLWIAKRYHARFIPQIHFDLFSAEWLRQRRLNRVRQLVARHVLRRAHAVRVVSEGQKQKLLNTFGLSAESIHTIPVIVNFDPSDEDKEHCRATLHNGLHDAKIVLFVGRLVEEKNMTLWVKVARQISSEEPSTRFVIAGSGPHFSDVQARVAACGLEDAFIFLGEVPYKKLALVYGAADVFLLTSHHEGFGRVIVEANLAGVPAVATTCAGPADIVVDGNTGYLCPAGDQECLAQRVLRLLRDDRQRQAFGASAKQRVETVFSKERLADSLVRMWSYP